MTAERSRSTLPNPRTHKLTPTERHTLGVAAALKLYRPSDLAAAWGVHVRTVTDCLLRYEARGSRS